MIGHYYEIITNNMKNTHAFFRLSDRFDLLVFRFFLNRLSLAVLLLSSIEVKAEIIVEYNFDGSDPSAASFVHPGVNASAFSSPMNISYASTAGDTGRTVGSPFDNSDQAQPLGALAIQVIDATTSSFNAAVAGNDYISFNVTPKNGMRAKLDSISFKATKKSGNSVDEYALTDDQGNMIGAPVAITEVKGLVGSYTEVVISLADLDQRYIEGAKKFRIYAWGRGSSNSNNTLAAIDEVRVNGSAYQKVSDSGRNSHFWVTLKPNAGTSSSVPSDLVLSNGYRSVDLGSSDLTCGRDVVGSKWRYNITWKGNNFLDGASAETLKFSVLVEAFSGTDYNYVANNSTVNSLGTTATPTNIDNNWGVGNDNDIDAGESIRFSYEGIKIGDVSLLEKGLTQEQSFDQMKVLEVNAGNNHKMIFGVGSNLRTVNFSSAASSPSLSGNSFVVTGAGSNAVSRQWAIEQVDFSFIVKNPTLTAEGSNYFFADIKDGHKYGVTPYAPTSDTKIAKAFPKFSWDVVPLSMLVRKGSQSFTDEESRRIATRHDLVVFEKANGLIAGYRDKAASLKVYNPDIKTVFYWNSKIYFGHQGVDPSILDNYDSYIDPEATIRDNLPTYQRGDPGFLNWWVGVAIKMMGLEQGTAVDGVTQFSPSNIDGAFIDKAGVPRYMLEPLYEGAGDSKFIMNNNGDGSRERLEFLDGTYREGWNNGGDDDSIIRSIALAKESAKNKKVTLLRNIDRNPNDARGMEQAVGFSLATYLMYAEKYSYFWHFKSVDATSAQYAWLMDYYDQYQRPLGQPLGDSIRDGKVFSRSFERCDAYLDLAPESGAASLSRILWKNDIGTPNKSGSGFSRVDDTYFLRGSGNISGGRDNFFYLSDLHYGDGSVEARLDSVGSSNSHINARSGVMFRERTEPASLDDAITDYKNGKVLEAGARMVAVLRDKDGGMSMVYRPDKDSELVQVGTANASKGPYARIVRDLDTFTGYTSSNGVNWVKIGQSVNILLNDRVEMGMAIASGNQWRINAEFSEFKRLETVVAGSPVFTNTNISLTGAKSGASFSGTLAGTATDPEGDALSYAIISGPEWLAISANGQLSGSPGALDTGLNSWVIRVTDGNGTDTVTLDITVEAPSPEIRVAEYYLTSGDFTGTVASITLNQNLANDYFILVRGSRAGNGLSMPDNDYARVVRVPGGKGDMVAVQGANRNKRILIERSAADFDWEGVVTVVECLNSDSPGGFKLLDILTTNLNGASGTDTSAAWSDINQVVLFGGYRGGGAHFVGSPTSRNQGTSLYTRLYPTGNSRLNWKRSAGGESLVDAVMTTFVVEWGDEWNVQRINVAGAKGGGGANATGEYITANIDAVNRGNSWVWGTGTRLDAGIGDSAEASLVTLGNGVAQNATENKVAVGSEYSDGSDFDVYVMTHADLAVDHRFKADGDSGVTDLAVTVDNATAGERFGWSYNGCNGTGDNFPRPRMWARYTANGKVTISRGHSGQNFPAWVQGIDFSGLND